MKKLLILAVYLFFSGQEPFSPNDKFKTKSVSVFKNGTAFFQKEIVSNTDKDKRIITKLPISENKVLFGTIWFNADNNEIKKIGTYSDTLQTNQKAENIYSMMLANKTKTMSLTIEDYNKAQTGKIEILKSDLLVFKTKDTWITTSPAKVKNITFKSRPLLSYQEKKVSDMIKIDLAKAQNNQKISLMYMQKGITWTPNYYIRVTGENKAEISLRANVVNDIEDIENTDINFVVGVPSFSFSHVEASFTSGQKVEDFIRSINGNSSQRRQRISMSNAVTSQSMYNYSNNSNESSDNESTFKAKGSTDEGLFFYKIPNVNLKAKERAFFELLSCNVEFEQIYSVDLSENTNNYRRYNNSSSNSSQNKVWHSMRFKNITKTPFTTGVAFIMRRENNYYKPVSQNYLYYTPSGIKTTVKTTISPDISVIDNEKEISRKERAIEYHDLITVESEIRIENFKNKAINLEIKRMITGEILKSSHLHKKTSKLKSWNSKNKLNDTRWDVKLKPGGKKTITYTYKIYVRR